MKPLVASDKTIAAAEGQLGVRFPEELKAVWRVSNGLDDFPGGWRLFPVFDRAEPRKTCSHIVYENTKARWEYMSPFLVSIAVGDTGNQLVLERQGDQLANKILLWDHETNRTRKWSKDFAYLLERATARCAKIEKMISRSMKMKQRRKGAPRQ
jgi:hypothetical protein